MATLTIPHTFVAGTPALASEVNANFQAIVAWTQSNISTDNLGILTARSIALPTSPTLAILSLQQTASQPALYLTNSGTDSSVTINQSGILATTKAALIINSPSTQTTAGAAEVAMNLATNSTIPALLINHGATPTMSLTKTQLSLFNSAVQVTSAGVISATTTNVTTANATNVNATGLVTITAPVGDAIALKIKGRSSDNNSIIQLKSNDDATVYASVTSSTAGVTLNIPDTADSYTFQVNGVTKSTISNNGIDGQYLKTNSVSESSFTASGFYNSGSRTFVAPNLNVNPKGAIVTFGSFTITQNRNLLLTWRNLVNTSTITTTGGVGTNLHLWVIVEGPGGFSYSAFCDGGGHQDDVSFTNTGGATLVPVVGLNCVVYSNVIGLNMQSVVPLTAGAGTYTVKLYAGSNNGSTFTMNNFFYSGNLVY